MDEQQDGRGAQAGRRVVWVTGAGSGTGRASALSAARAGWAVAASGRRPEPLDALVADVGAGAGGGRALAVPLDARDPAAVAAARDRVLAELGRLDALVLAAGLNTPRRTWADQDLATFSDVVATNLTGVVAVVDAALPALRAAGGVVVVVSSRAAWRHSPGSGVAYSASKTALRAVVATLNAEEAAHGVRATHLCPGDIDTDFLRLRPAEPDAAARARMLSADDVARAVQFVLDAPPHVRVEELVVSPLSQV